MLWIIPALVLFMVGWPYLRNLFSKFIIPGLRSVFGSTLAAPLEHLVALIDAPVSVFRASVGKVYSAFKSRVLGIESTHTRKGVDGIETETAIFTPLVDGKIQKINLKQMTDWSSLPLNIREEMIRLNTEVARTDDRGALDEGVRKRAAEHGVELPADPTN